MRKNISNFASIRHASIIKNVSFNLGMMFPLPSNFFQSFTKIHAIFYDPVNIWLEEFQDKNFVNKFILLNLLIVHNRLKFSFYNLVSVLLLLFDLYIEARIKMRKWLHWKYDYTYSCFLPFS